MLRNILQVVLSELEVATGCGIFFNTVSAMHVILDSAEYFVTHTYTFSLPIIRVIYFHS